MTVSVVKEKLEIVEDDYILVVKGFQMESSLVVKDVESAVIFTPRQNIEAVVTEVFPPVRFGEGLLETPVVNSGGVVKPAAVGRAISSLSTKNGWASPKKGSSLEERRYARPLVLSSLSAYTRESTVDPIVWFNRAKAALRSASVCGAHFSEEQGIAMVMDRAEAGTVIATWYSTLNDHTLRDNELFEGAFRKRFGISKTIEAAGVKLQTMKSSKFRSLDVFYEEFVDLVAIVGEARSHWDIVKKI